MTNRTAYSYSILRYVHDIATGEFVNVGVVVHSQSPRFFQARCRTTYRRVSEFFPDLDTHAFKTLMRTLNQRLSELARNYSDSLELSQKDSLESLMMSVLPMDDSSIRWTPPANGITSDIGKVVSQLHARYVARYDHTALSHKRTDEDVLRHFSKELERRHIAKYFVEKTVQGDDDTVQFKTAWKNGKWHCVQSMSFDLSAGDSIRSKARLFLGQMTSVADTNEQLKLYLVVSPPSEPSLKPAYKQAIQILRKITNRFDQEIIAEDQVPVLAERFQIEITEHERTH